jgi:hypothetical protein
VDAHTYVHGEWILWPRRLEPSLAADILSLFGPWTWHAEAASRGRAFLASTQSRRIHALQPGLLPPEWEDTDPDLVVGQVADWDEVAAIVRRTQGRVLVAEWPPNPGENWARYWFYGQGWPSGLPLAPGSVPGLLAASALPTLVLQPDRFTWVDNDAARWGGANRWFEHVRHNGSAIFLAAGILLLYVSVCAVSVVMQERRGSFAAALLVFAMSVPSASLIGTALDRSFGLLNWPLHHLAGLGAAAGFAWAGGAWCLRRRAHRLWPVFLLAGFAFLATDRTWTFFSPIFSESPLRASGATAGILLASLSAILSLSQGKVRWAAVALCLMAGLHPGLWPWGAIVATIAVIAFLSDRPFRLVLSLAAIVSLVALGSQVVRTGFSYAPDGLLRNASEIGTVNFARHVEALSTPASAVLVAFLLGIWLLRDPYLSARARRVFRSSPMHAHGARAASFAAVVGLCIPSMLTASVYALIAGGLALLYDAVTE